MKLEDSIACWDLVKGLVSAGVGNGISESGFGLVSSGREARVFELVNGRGMRVRVSDYGATLVGVEVPDRDGSQVDVALGYDEAAGYEGGANPYFGASIGRFGNRIAGGKFSLDGVDYDLATNNDPGGIPCHLHGGVVGFNRVFWEVEVLDDANAVSFTYLSRDGEEGYPGNLKVKVSYLLTEENELLWNAEATTDVPTIVNLVHHSYWNLAGHAAGSTEGHEIQIHAEKFLPGDAGMIPSGELAEVAGTPMDFREPHVIGERVEEVFEPLQLAAGYDHCWVLGDGVSDQLRPAARVREPKSGRVMEVLTNQPGVQFYGANFLGEADFQGENLSGKGGAVYTRRGAFCLETENFPDAPNKPSFPSAELRPGEVYRHAMVHRFLVE